MSIVELQREIRRRERGISGLIRRRNKVARKLAALDAQIADAGGSVAALGGRGGRGASTRARNKTNLVDALSATLRGKTLSVTDAADAVRKAGYQTSSPNFRTMVNAALLKKKFFKRVERGMYTAA